MGPRFAARKDLHPNALHAQAMDPIREYRLTSLAHVTVLGSPREPVGHATSYLRGE